MASSAATEESAAGPAAAAAGAATREELIASLSRHFSEDIDGMVGEIVADSDGLTREQGPDSIETKFGLSFALKNRLRFNFDSETFLN